MASLTANSCDGINQAHEPLSGLLRIRVVQNTQIEGINQQIPIHSIACQRILPFAWDGYRFRLRTKVKHKHKVIVWPATFIHFDSGLNMKPGDTWKFS